MADECPRCGLVFERSQGYWLGAMTISLGLTVGAVLLVVVGWIVLAWPDVPWTTVTVAGALAGVVIPLLSYDHARMLWVALERQFRSRSEPYT
jgi:hypothetical protein